MNIKESKNPSSVYRLGIAVVAVAVLISWFAVIMPQMSARGEAQATAETARAEEKELSAKVVSLTKQSSDGQESLTRLQDLTTAFPNSFAQSQFLNLVRISARSAGVEIQSVASTQPADPGRFDEQGTVIPPVAPVPDTSPGAEPDPANAAQTPEQAAADSFPLAQITVIISLNGTNNGIERFLATIAALERPIIVDLVTIGASTSASGGASASATISGRTYLSRPLVVPKFKK